MTGFNYKKAIQTLIFFAEKEGGSIKILKVLKLLWLADRYHLRNHGRPIIQDSYYAMPHGPVASITRDIIEGNVTSDAIKEYRKDTIKKIGYYIEAISKFNDFVFSETDIEALEKVYAEFGKLTEFQIRDLSHKYPEWKKWESKIHNGTSKSYSMKYEDFFENPESPDPLFHDDEKSVKISRLMFEESSKIRDFFQL